MYLVLLSMIEVQGIHIYYSRCSKRSCTEGDTAVLQQMQQTDFGTETTINKPHRRILQEWH